MARYVKWYTHPIFYMKHDGYAPDLQLSEILKMVEDYWNKEKPKNIFTDLEYNVLNQSEAMTLNHSMRYETRQDERATYRSENKSWSDIEKKLPLIGHCIEIGEMDLKVYHSIAEKMPSDLKKQLLNVQSPAQVHVDIWLKIIERIRTHSNARFLMSA